MGDRAVGKERLLEPGKLAAPRLAAFLAQQRWFGGKGREVQSTEIVDSIPIRGDTVDALLLIVRVSYAGGLEEIYAIPVLDTERIITASGRDLTPDGQELPLTDALQHEEVLAMLLRMISSRAMLPGKTGELRGFRTTAYEDLIDHASESTLKPRAITGEQSNSSVIYGEKLILKFFRRIEAGVNPEVEIGSFLAKQTNYPHIPPLAGWLEYRTRDGRQMVQAILQAFVPNQGDAWRYTLKCLSRFYEAAARESPPETLVGSRGLALTDRERELPEFAREPVGPYLELVGLLGKRTAELHRALGSEQNELAFAPTPFTMEFQRDLEKSLRALTTKVLALLREKTPSLAAEWRDKSNDVAAREHEIAQRFQSILARPIHAARTRIHGDYHLGQVLCTGSDFVIIDFEGEPARSLGERRVKRSPLQDVAGMLRSFHYAAFAPLLGAAGERRESKQELERLSSWAESWYSWAAQRFLAEYFDTSREASYLPPDSTQAHELLELHLLEKVIYELGYELNNRPNWVGIPLEGISRLLAAGA